MSSDQRAAWRRATDSEMDSIDKAGTWILVPPPPGRSAIGCKWVFKTKRGADGSIVKHKARLVANGFLQRYGVDYDETYAPVARYPSIRAILALAAHYDWELLQMDVRSAYLNGELEEDIYMEQPEGYVAAGQEQLVCKLSKALYGSSRQAAPGTPRSTSRSSGSSSRRWTLTTACTSGGRTRASPSSRCTWTTCSSHAARQLTLRR